MAIFKKLSVGDIVATSGTRAFRKLTTAEVTPDLPVWNGTDLADTTWKLRSGWSAEAGYGEFDIAGRVINSGSGATVSFSGFLIGYDSKNSVNRDSRFATSNSVIWATLFDRTLSDTAEEQTFIIGSNGTDTTNPRLIEWLIWNARLTSHQPVHRFGLYDSSNNLVASWDELVNTYGMNVEKSYSSSTYKTDTASPYCVLTNNSELSSGTKLVVADGVTRIGSRAFRDCANLTSVTIPDGVTSISDYAFAYCTNLASVDLPDSLGHLGVGAFGECYSLERIAIPASVISWASGMLGAYTFSNCTSLKSIFIPFKMWEILWYSFAGCTSLESVTIPSRVSEIQPNAFLDCNALKDVYYLGTEEQWNEIAIGSGNECLTNATIHYNCGGLYDADNNLVASWDTLVNTYGMNVEKDYTGETYDTDTASPYCVLTNNPELTNGTKLVIANGVNRIGDFTFFLCNNIFNIFIPDSVTFISGKAFHRCEHLTAFFVSLGNENYWSDDRGVLYTKNLTTVIKAPCSIKGAYTLHSSVTTIGDLAFNYCRQLTSITIGSAVAIIGGNAFNRCERLTNVIVPDGVTTINSWTFNYCYRLQRVVIPNSVKSIGEMAFNYVGDLCSGNPDVYYKGTEEQWAAISIAYGNNTLLNANIHYNYTD